VLEQTSESKSVFPRSHLAKNNRTVTRLIETRDPLMFPVCKQRRLTNRLFVYSTTFSQTPPKHPKWAEYSRKILTIARDLPLNSFNKGFLPPSTMQSGMQSAKLKEQKLSTRTIRKDSFRRLCMSCLAKIRI
jgi:hypothetical protein